MRRLGTRGRVVEAEAGAKQAMRDERAKKREEKAAKQIRADGQSIRIKAGDIHDHIETIAGARQRMTDWIYESLGTAWLRANKAQADPTWAAHLLSLSVQYEDAAKQVLPHLAARLGEPPEALWAEAEKKATAKYKKNYTQKSELVDTLVLKARLTPKQHMKRIQAVLRPEDRQPQYRGHPHCLGGHCYVAAEALYHKIGREKSGYVPTHVKHEGTSHWFLRHRETGHVLDPTAAQFKTPVPYEQGRGIGFQGKDPSVPSERARRVMARLVSKALGQAPAPAVEAAPKRVRATQPKIVLKVKPPAEPKYKAPGFIVPPPRKHVESGEVYPEESGAHNTMSAFSEGKQQDILKTTQSILGHPEVVRQRYHKLFDDAKATEHYAQDKDWYWDAHNFAHQIAGDHGFTHHHVAGAIAAISSGAEWGNNQAIAKGLARHVKENTALTLTPEEHAAFARDLRQAELDSKGRKVRSLDTPAVGTTFNAIEHPVTAAIAANHLQKAESKTEDAPGKKWQIGHGYDGLAKAVRIYRGAHPRTVLGGGKVRSFYNNILDPEQDRDVTIDRHMYNAAADRLIPDKNELGKLNSTPSATFQGHLADLGVKPYLADIVREIAKKHGLRAHEVQAVIWNHWLRLEGHKASERAQITKQYKKELQEAKATGTQAEFAARHAAARVQKSERRAHTDLAYRLEHRIDPFWGQEDETAHHPFPLGRPRGMHPDKQNVDITDEPPKRKKKKTAAKKSLVLKAKSAPASKPGPREVRPLKPSEGAVPVRHLVQLHLPETGHGRVQDHTIAAPKDAAHLMGTLKDKDREHFWTIHTDAHGRHLGNEHVSMGTLGASLVHPREVFKAAQLSGARKLWLLHNHPSGDPTPSQEDTHLTGMLHRAGQALGIESMGHVILGDKEFTHLSPDGQTATRHPMPEAPAVPERFDIQTQKTPREAPFDQKLDSADRVAHLGQHLFHPTHPSVMAAYLDSQNKINGVEHVADGELETEGPHLPANRRHIEAAVLRAAHGALRHNAASVVFMSNVHHAHTVGGGGTAGPRPRCR